MGTGAARRRWRGREQEREKRSKWQARRLGGCCSRILVPYPVLPRWGHLHSFVPKRGWIFPWSGHAGNRLSLCVFLCVLCPVRVCVCVCECVTVNLIHQRAAKGAVKLSFTHFTPASTTSESPALFLSLSTPLPLCRSLSLAESCHRTCLFSLGWESTVKAVVSLTWRRSFTHILRIECVWAQEYTQPTSLRMCESSATHTHTLTHIQGQVRKCGNGGLFCCVLTPSITNTIITTTPPSCRPLWKPTRPTVLDFLIYIFCSTRS